MDRLITLILENIVTILGGVITLGTCFASWRVWQASAEARIRRLEEDLGASRLAMDKTIDRLEAMEKRFAKVDVREAEQAKDNEKYDRHYEKIENWMIQTDQKFDKVFELLSKLRA